MNIRSIIKSVLPQSLRIQIRQMLNLNVPAAYGNLPDQLDRFDTFIVSYPKSGRTWLRMMLNRVLFAHYGIDDEAALLYSSQKLADTYPQLPAVVFTHDDDPHWKTVTEIQREKDVYRDKRVIFLVRDPRDVLVSYYFEITKRSSNPLAKEDFQGEITEFLQYERGSLENIVAFYNVWAAQHHVPQDFLLVTYEDMHENSQRELRRILDFMGLDAISTETIAQAVELSRFERMRKLEQSRQFDGRLTPGDEEDPDSYKVRRGKVGGYVDYFGEEDIQYIDQYIADNLSSYFERYR